MVEDLTTRRRHNTVHNALLKHHQECIMDWLPSVASFFVTFTSPIQYPASLSTHMQYTKTSQEPRVQLICLNQYTYSVRDLSTSGACFKCSS